MQKVALSSSAPFYKQLVNLEIKPLDSAAIRDFIKKYLKKKISKEGLDLLLEKSSGIPYNLQILGRQMCELKENTLDRTSVKTAIDEILKREGEFHFKDYLNMMQSTEIKVLKTMAVYDVNSPSKISDAINMELNEVTSLLKLLLDKGLIKRIDRGQYQFADNMFKTWLGRFGM
jgi:DNA-binding transcriptional ArsR family regulator